MDEKTMEKIRKLLALGTSSNENEAFVAMTKARELMAKHKLSEKDFEESKPQELIQMRCWDIKWTTDSGEVFLTDIVNVIAENHCCAAAWYTPKGTRTHILDLIGFEDDVQVCKAVVGFAVNFVRIKSGVLVRKSTRDSKSVIKSYMRGFAIGLECQYEEQTEKHQEWGLVVQTPKEVEDAISGFGHKQVRSRGSSNLADAMAAGYADGKKFSSKAVLEA